MVQDHAENDADHFGVGMNHEMFKRTWSVQDQQDAIVFIFKEFRLVEPVDLPEALVYIKVLFHDPDENR